MTPLLAVKQVIPPVRPGAVQRDRLERQLRAARTRLTVVVAPAGWVKASLLSAWAANPGDQVTVAWVSLDEIVAAADLLESAEPWFFERGLLPPI